MKKLLTLRNVILCCAAVLILAVFIMSFFVSFNVSIAGIYYSYKHVLWGCDKVAMGGTELTISELENFSGATLKAMALPLAGLIMMVVGVAGAVVVALLVKKPFAKYIVMGLGLVALAGGIMQFWPIESFARSYVNSIKGVEQASQAEIDEAINFYIKVFKDGNSSAPVAVVMGILGCLSGVAVVASQVVPEKELLK